MSATKSGGPTGKATGSFKTNALLERLREFENDALRFIEIKDVPFTNNQGENDIRMKKYIKKYRAVSEVKTVRICFVCSAVTYPVVASKMFQQVRRCDYCLRAGFLTSFHLRDLNSYNYALYEIKQLGYPLTRHSAVF